MNRFLMNMVVVMVTPSQHVFQKFGYGLISFYVMIMSRHDTKLLLNEVLLYISDV